MRITHSMVMFGLCSGLLFVLLTLNGFLISIRAPLKMMLLSVRVRPSAIPITSSSSSDRFVYSDERKKLYPDYEKERSYERYLGRLKEVCYRIQFKRGGVLRKLKGIVCHIIRLRVNMRQTNTKKKICILKFRIMYRY